MTGREDDDMICCRKRIKPGNARDIEPQLLPYLGSILEIWFKCYV